MADAVGGDMAWRSSSSRTQPRGGDISRAEDADSEVSTTRVYCTWASPESDSLSIDNWSSVLVLCPRPT